MDGFNKHLNIADEIDIMIFTTSGQSLTLSTFVYDVTSDNRMILSNPIKDGALFPLEKSYTYYFRFYVENSGMFLFKGILIDRIKFDNLPSIVIQLESDIKRVQRRKFYRVSFLSIGARFRLNAHGFASKLAYSPSGCKLVGEPPGARRWSIGLVAELADAQG